MEKIESKKSLESIERIYLENLKIPEKVSGRQIFLCPVGLVGAGRTTVISPISDKMGLLRISSDELRRLLKESGYDYKTVKEIIPRIIKKFADDGYGIAFDMDCGNPETFKLIDQLKVDHPNSRAIWIDVSASEEFIINKFKSHPPSWLADNPQKMIDNYLSQKEKRASSDIKYNFDYKFDTSRDDLDNQILDFIERFRD